MTAAIVIQTIIMSILTAGLLASVSVALTLEVGVTRIVNFAHGEFVMLGAYVVYYLTTYAHFNIFEALLCSVVVIAIFSWVVFRLFLLRVIKQPEHDQLLATLGLSIVIVNVTMMAVTPDARMMQVPDILPSIQFGGAVLPGNSLFAALVGFATYAGLWWLMRKSRWGIPIRFAAADPELAAYSGVNVDRMFALSFIIGGAFAGLGGGLIACVLAITPSLGLDFVIRSFTIIVLGGVGSIPGALIGAVILSTVEGVSSVLIPNGGSWAFGVSFAVFFAVLILRPYGLFNRSKEA
jgi:branched-chain amino acid transport system permease protein